MPADDNVLNVLLVDDSLADARLVREQLAEETQHGELVITHVQTLLEGQAALQVRRFDCVLLDLNLPDASGISNVQRIKSIDRRLPIVVLTGLNDERAALEALQRGAQDYLVKGNFDGSHVLRAVRHAVERNRLLVELERLREQEYFLATHDSLTGLPNRQLFVERAKHAKTQAERRRGEFVICYLDLDGFKPVNDVHGHAIGDRLLCKIARSLLDAVREGDTVARLGGDEFVMLLTTLRSSDDAALVLRRQIQRVAAITDVDGHPVKISASAGFAAYPADAGDPENLMVQADTAMYAAKRAGGGTVVRATNNRTVAARPETGRLSAVGS